MDINYELYKVFYYVAISLSFSEASRKLFISQSAVSQSIKVLEKKLNQPLFIRSTKKVQLTPEGEILLGHGTHIRFIKDFKDCFIASRKYYGELEHQPLSFKDLLNYPILMLNRNSTTSEFLHSLFQQNQLDLVPEIELSSNDLLIDLASIGLGIAFVPDFCVSRTSGDLFQIPLKNELPGRQLAIIHSEQMPVSNAARQFMSYF